MPVTQTFTASRNATWAPTLVYPYPGPQLPLNGAHIAMQIRLFAGAPGDAVLTLNPIDYTDELASGGAGEVDEVRWLTLSPGIDSDTLELFPTGLNQPEPGDADRFFFDIRITYADGLSEILSSGTFSLTSGVTTA